MSIRLVAATLAAVMSTLGFVQARPNVVLIVADDLGTGDVSAMRAGPDVGSRSVITTPHIDALAERGVLFLDARSPASVCTPTRAAILTGQHLHRNQWGIRNGIVKPFGSTVIAPDQWTIAKYLRRHGYATSWVGKNHLGFDWYLKSGGIAAPGQRERDWRTLDLSRPYARGPLTFGFDSFFGVDAPNFPPYSFIDQDRIVGRLTSWKGPGQFGIEGLAVPGWRVDQVFRRLRREGVRELERLAKGDKPFFLYLPLTAPHTPITPSPQFRGTTSCGPYCDFVAEVDHHVGEIERALRRHGKLRDTIFVFASDNGSPARYDHDSRAGSLLRLHRPNGRLRGLKAGPMEGGLRVPLIISWPGGGLTGESAANVSLIDLAPTIADLIGRPLLSRHAARDASTFAHEMIDVRPRRRRMDDKGEFGQSLYGKPTLRWRHWKLIQDDADTIRLYNLRRDPGERRDVAARRPEVARRMAEQMEWWR